MPKSLISGIGVYAPPKQVPMRERESLFGRRRTRIPIERITGIKSVHVAEGEFAITMAHKAILKCLSNAGIDATEIDLLISCSIGRHDKPDLGHVFEPCTAFRLKQMLGAEGAHAFDVSNACAGLMTGILVADTFIRTGRSARALVVSGEYISHLADCAAREISGLSDPRMACLTLGDGAAAVLMTPTTGPAGFAAMRMYSLPEHSDLCVAGPSSEPHGGVVMKTNSAELSRVMIDELQRHVPVFLREAGRTGACVDWVIPHQTSIATVREAAKAINRSLGHPLCTTESVLMGLESYGNTASTSHILALDKHIQSDRVLDGDTVLFSVNASGLTVGSALYRFDDLPSRHGVSPRAAPALAVSHPRVARSGRIACAAFGEVQRESDRRRIVQESLAEAGVRPADLDLLIYAGVYRAGFVVEPCWASLLAKECGLGIDAGEAFLAFDVFAGPSGFLHALAVANEMLATGQKRCAMIVAGDEEPNPENPLGFLPSLGAVVLHPRQGTQSKISTATDHSGETGLCRFTIPCGREARIVSEGVAKSSCDSVDLLEAAVWEAIHEHRPDLVLTTDACSDLLRTRFGFLPEQIVTPGLAHSAFSADLIAAWRRACAEGKLQPGKLALFLGYSDIGEATALLMEV